MLLNLITIALFSSWPPYLPIFLHGARHNADVRFTLITNLDENHPSWKKLIGNITKPSNVILAPYTFKMIVEKINKDNLGLGMNLSVTNPYKLIDFKPMFGVLFRKELIGFSHWGWFDLDIHIGDIKASYEHGYENEDFVTYDPLYNVQGPLMILRNTELVNNFYLNMLSRPEIMSMFKDASPMIFDEITMPKLIKDNSSVVLKVLNDYNCGDRKVDPSIWMWYKGNMQHDKGPCVINHFGGGGDRQSRIGKEREWSHIQFFFKNKFYESGDYGYGFSKFARKNGMARFAFVFNFSDTNKFQIVSSTLSRTHGFDKNSGKKFAHMSRVISARFHRPNQHNIHQKKKSMDIKSVVALPWALYIFLLVFVFFFAFRYQSRLTIKNQIKQIFSIID